MEVNFDALRRKGATAYNKLVKEFNRRVDGEKISVGMPHGDALHTGDIRDQLNGLHDFIGALLSLESESEGIKAIEDVKLLVFDEEGA
jgi:hypothetical protein